MGRKIGYWISTSIVLAMMLLDSALYLSGATVAVEGFTHLGYPQHLRIILGIAKLAGAMVLIVPGLRLLKEWAYAGFTFAWIVAAIAHHLAGDGIKAVTPLVLLVFLIVSYLTRPAGRYSDEQLHSIGDEYQLHRAPGLVFGCAFARQRAGAPAPHGNCRSLLRSGRGSRQHFPGLAAIRKVGFCGRLQGSIAFSFKSPGG